METKATNTTLKYVYKIIDIVVYSVGAVMAIGGMAILAIPFLLENMDYWPQCIIGALPMIVGSGLAFWKMHQYEKWKTIKEANSNTQKLDQQQKDHDFKMKELELKHSTNIKVKTMEAKND